MPIWLRNFTFRKMQEFYEKEKESYEKASKKNTLGNFNTIKKPTYSTKARK